MQSAVPFFPMGTVSEQKKVKNSTPLEKCTILVPLGTLLLLSNHVYETVPLDHWRTEIVPIRVPYYWKSHSAPRGTVRYPFFWVRAIITKTVIVSRLNSWVPHLRLSVWQIDLGFKNFRLRFSFWPHMLLSWVSVIILRALKWKHQTLAALVWVLNVSTEISSKIHVWDKAAKHWTIPDHTVENLSTHSKSMGSPVSKIIMAMKLAYGPVHHGYIKNHV